MVNHRYLWLVFFACLSHMASTTVGQVPDNPERLMSRKALMLLDIPNAGQALKGAKKHWYDIYFGEAVSNGSLSALGPSPIKKVRSISQIQGSKSKHWLSTVFSSFRLNNDPAIAKVTDLIAGLNDNSAQGDEVVEAIAELFPGRVAFGLEPLEKGLAAILSFDIDEDAFDWNEEFLEMHRLDPDSEVRSFSDVDIYDIDSMGLSFFKNGSSLIVVASNELGREELSEEVLTRLGNDGETLQESRYFKRVIAALGERPKDQIFGFVRYASIFPRLESEAKGKKLGDFGRFMDFENVFASNSCGFILKFAEDADYRFKAAFPMLAQKSDPVNVYLEQFQELDFEKERMLAAGVSRLVFSKPSKREWTARMQPSCAHSLFSVMNCTREKKKNSERAFMPNPQRFLVENSIEECSIEIEMLDLDRRFLSKSEVPLVLNMPPLSGYQIDRSEAGAFSSSDFLQEASPMIISAEFADLKDRLATFGISPLSGVWKQAEFLEKDGDIRSMDKEIQDKFRLHQFGDGRPLFIVGSNSTLSFVFNSSPLKNGSLVSRLKAQLSGDPLPFRLREHFPEGIRGEIKIIGIERSLTRRGFCSHAMQPIVTIGKFAYLNRQPDRNNAPLLKLARLLLSFAISKESFSGYVVRMQTPLALKGGKIAVTAMSVSDTAIHYETIMK